MGNLRVRWQSAARALAALAAAGLAITLAPGLLKTPEPPPIAADVGLPRVIERTGSSPRPPEPRAPRVGLGRAKALPARRHRHHRPKDAGAAIPKPPSVPQKSPLPQKLPPGDGPTPPAYVPTPSPTPVPAPPPVPAPTPQTAPAPTDGSEEFAPH